LMRHGIRPDFVPPRYVSEEVADGLLERTEPDSRILLYRAQEARDVVPETLRAEGRHVDVIAAYKTVTVHDPTIADAAADADVWTFTSASTVRGFVENVPDAARLTAGRTVACIGPITAEAAREAGLRVDVVAEEYTYEGLFAALETAFAPAR
jgi:uroporphyrinogen-III synthase